MTLLPCQVGDLTSVYNRLLKIQSSASEPERPEPQDIVSISAEAKRNRILEEAKHAVLERVRRVK